jgi:hypothetical protein
MHCFHSLLWTSYSRFESVMKSGFRSVSVTHYFHSDVWKPVIVSVKVLEMVSENEGMSGSFGFEVGRSLDLEADHLELLEWGATKWEISTWAYQAAGLMVFYR